MYKKIIEIRNQKEIEDEDFFECIDDHEEIDKILNQIDSKIPNQTLWEFHGGIPNEFVIYNN